jgi:hypothetical protein
MKIIKKRRCNKLTSLDSSVDCYLSVLKELNEFNLSNEFEFLFSKFNDVELVNMVKIKKFKNKRLTASLIRNILSFIPNETLLHDKWTFIFNYFLQLQFVRNKQTLITFLSLK